MQKGILLCISGILATFICPSLGYGEDLTISPLICGANAEYDFAGLYYGTLPKSDPRSRREEFKKLLKEKEIRAIRFPGGTPAITQFLVDNDELMQKVMGTASIPEWDPKKYVTLWQFLDFCKEAGITPIYQVNTLYVLRRDEGLPDIGSGGPV